MHRIEKDLVGEIEIEKSALYGIHSVRARENFPDNTPFHIEWYKALGSVKRACYETYKNFKFAAQQKYEDKKINLPFFSDEIIDSMTSVAKEIEEGKYFEWFIVPAISGGAGTSINLNINEIIANATLLTLNYQPGDYNKIDPFENANIYQSTNDVIPTSLKVATLKLLLELEDEINLLRQEVEKKESKYRNALRIGYTQMQEAVPTSYGRLFSTYSDALSRDWWRISKCFERIKTVNLGGSAIGTGLTVPRYFIKEVVKTLQNITGLPIAQAENLQDNTSNHDSFVEIHGILKAHAVNLEKMVSDLRLLSSDFQTQKELNIPAKQTGSSIMPGKINPVIPEFVISAAHKIYSNDNLISSLAGQGCLELNPYLPTIGHALIESLKLLIAANKTLKDNLFPELEVESEKAQKKLLLSPTIATVLLPFIGYKKATLIAKTMKKKKCDIFTANTELAFINPEKLKQLLEAENILKEGFTLGELYDDGN